MAGTAAAGTGGLGASSTLVDVDATGRRRSSSARHRAIVALLLVVVLFGAAGLFGVRTGTVTATADGVRLQVVYPRVARSGMDVPLRFEIRRAGGFDGPVTLAVSQRYFDIFETQGFYPEASAVTSTPRFAYFTFDPPPGDRLDVSFDGYIQPASQIGRRATAAVVAGGQPEVHVRFATFLVP